MCSQKIFFLLSKGIVIPVSYTLPHSAVVSVTTFDALQTQAGLQVAMAPMTITKQEVSDDIQEEITETACDMSMEDSDDKLEWCSMGIWEVECFVISIEIFPQFCHFPYCYPWFHVTLDLEIMENSIFYVNNSWHYSILYFMLKCLIIVLIFICLLLFTWFYCFMLQEKRKIKNLIYIWQCVVNVVDNKEYIWKKTYLRIFKFVEFMSPQKQGIRT